MIKWLGENRKFSIIFFILIAIEIFLVSSVPGGSVSTTGISGVSIAYHFITFFLLSFFLLISINGKEKIRIRYLLVAIPVLIIYSILDEVHQIFVPLRNSSLQDILIDGVGIFSSSLLYLNYKARQ